jgi:hypothetical protein
MRFFTVVRMLMSILGVSKLCVNIVSVMRIGRNHKAGGIRRSFKAREHESANKHYEDSPVHNSLILRYGLS